MIKNFKAKSGFAANLKELKDRTFEFTDGINILFGPNGCGKTTIIKMCAAYSGVQQVGWTRPEKPRFDKNTKYPDNFKNNSPDKCEAVVDWDGSPSFYMKSDEVQNLSHFIEDESSFDGVTNFKDHAMNLMARPSSGQQLIHKMEKLIKQLKNSPKYHPYDFSEKNINDVWQKAYTDSSDYYNSLPRDGRICVLLDELDRSLSIETQFLFQTKFLANLVENKFQVIIASHSPFALVVSDANIIDVVPGYSEYSLEILKKSFRNV